MKLAAGSFYRDKIGNVWCCYLINMEEQENCQARCVRLDDHRLEYFYLDGRYDSEGLRGVTLIAKVPVHVLRLKDGSTCKAMVEEPE